MSCTNLWDPSLFTDRVESWSRFRTNTSSHKHMNQDGTSTYMHYCRASQQHMLAGTPSSFSGRVRFDSVEGDNGNPRTTGRQRDRHCTTKQCFK
jgi:hypothetical protein